MHDCPTCRVPLHGWEENCPSCGTRQVVRKSFGYMPKVQEAPGVNPMPFIVVAVVLVIGLLVVSQSTWIGQLMKQGPREVDPLEKMTYLEARQIIESEIGKGLTNVGATGKFTWKSGETEIDKNTDQPLELSIETKLSDPEQRRAIIDPVKQYMEKAKIPTLVMNDTKSRATWTYTVAPPAQSTSAEGGAEGASAE